MKRFGRLVAALACFVRNMTAAPVCDGCGKVARVRVRRCAEFSPALTFCSLACHRRAHEED